METCQIRLVIKIDRILHDVALAIEIRKNVDGGVGDEDGLAIGRNIHHEHVADAPLRAQPADLRSNASHQLVSVQAAFHQHLALARVNELNGLCCGSLAVGASTSSKSLISISCLSAAALIFAEGPTRLAQ